MPPEVPIPSDAQSNAEWKLLLAALPEPDGTMLWLHTVDGWTSAELGARYGMPAGTVRSKLHFAAKQLKKRLGGTQYV